MDKRLAPAQHNRLLLVLCDSRAQDTYPLVETTFTAALNHWGIPYHIHDLAKGALTAELLGEYAALLVAQQNLSATLDDEMASTVARAVADGLGYIGGDGGPGYMPASIQHMLGVQSQDVQPTIAVRCVDTEHFVSCWQQDNTLYRFRQAIQMTDVVPTMARVRVLAESGGRPALWVTQYGRGRVVQWALSPAVWQRQVFGHGEGLDDLLWRGIVWAAQKPFAMLAMPPFSTFVVGNAIGSHDFAWIDTLYQHGFPPNVGIFPDDIDTVSELRGQSAFADRAVEAIRHDTEQRIAEFCPHAATWDRAYLFYSRADGSSIPTKELKQRLTAVDKQLARYGISWPRTLNPHYSQLAKNALPFLQERGVAFTLGEFYPGEASDGEHRLWNGDPYNHPGFTIAPLPMAPDFYVVTSGRSHLETTIPTGPGTYQVRREAYHRANDFMWGRTRWKEQNRTDDWDAMACAAERQIRLGLNALFFASPKTNEQTIACVSLDEWAALWHEIDRRVARYERWPALYSHVAAYARAKHRTRLVNAHFDGVSLACTLEGQPDLPLYLYVWQDCGDSEWASHHYAQVLPFAGQRRMQVVM